MIDWTTFTAYSFLMHTLLTLYLRLFHFWMKFPQQIRFVLVGGFNTVVSYLLFAGLLLLIHQQSEQIALFLSYVFSSICSYLTQKFFVFNTRGNYVSEYLKCVATWVVSYGLNAVLLAVFVSYFAMNPYVAQGVCILIITINSFILLKYFAFAKLK